MRTAVHILIFCLISPSLFALEETDFFYGVEKEGDQVKFWFQSKTGSPWVDVHYRKANTAQMNHRMIFTNDRWEKVVSEPDITLTTGEKIFFYFTYGALAKDSAQFEYIFDDQADYKVWVESDADRKATIWFESNVNSSWVDVHYKKNGNDQRNYRMAKDGNRFYAITDYPFLSNDVLQYSFTYTNGTKPRNPAYDTSWSSAIYPFDQTVDYNWSVVDEPGTNGKIQFQVTQGPNPSLVYVHYSKAGTGQWYSSQMSFEGSFYSAIINEIIFNDSDKLHYYFEVDGARFPATGYAEASFPYGIQDPWTLVWNDEFEVNGPLNPANWNYHIGNGYDEVSRRFTGWGNSEWEWYRQENAYVDNGNLVIKAEYLQDPLNIAGRQWYQTSGRVTTEGLNSWKYGRIEARIKIPAAAGAWPAFWMVGESSDGSYNAGFNGIYDDIIGNWASCGEIDIMEHRNYENLLVSNVYWDSRAGVFPWNGGTILSAPTENTLLPNPTEFHLYTLEWDENELRFYLDRDQQENPEPYKVEDISSGNQEEFHKPFYIILNLAISGRFTNWTEPDPNEFPLYMYVDYVRVYQKTNSGISD